MPKAIMFGEYLHESIFDKAAAYLFHIVCNHAFVDGNKRTGAAVALIFLRKNSINRKFNINTFEEMVCKVTKSEMNKNEISQFFTIDAIIHGVLIGENSV
jgi:death-on-curing protein